jgi:hypothetical protein
MIRRILLATLMRSCKGLSRQDLHPNDCHPNVHNTRTSWHTLDSPQIVATTGVGLRRRNSRVLAGLLVIHNILTSNSLCSPANILEVLLGHASHRHCEDNAPHSPRERARLLCLEASQWVETPMLELTMLSDERSSIVEVTTCYYAINMRSIPSQRSTN